MVAVKTHQADAFLKGFEKSSATAPSAVLLYGTDAGLVAERAAGLAKRLAERENPPGEILRIDDTSLEDDPGRITVELQTAPMFGGRKIVRAAAGRRITAAALKPLVESGTLQGFLIVEAGNLRPDDALRGLFEKAPHAAAVACFPDEARDLEGMIREVLAAAKLQITPEARAMLIARLGADRGLSRAEVEKLALYALRKGTIEEGDVRDRRRRRGRAGARPDRDGRRVGPRCGSGQRMRPQHRGRRGCADRDPGPAAALPAAAPRAQRPRRRTDHGRRVAPAEARPAFQAEGRLRAAMPRLDPAQAQRRHWPRSPKPPSARA